MKRIHMFVATAALAFASTLAGAQDSELVVFDWAGYEDPTFHQDYVDEHGHSPTFAFFGDEDEAFGKLMAGFKADIAHPCSQSVTKWREAGMLLPLDTSRIKHWDDIVPGIAAMPNFMFTEDGRAWTVPFEWGNTALTYNTSRVSEHEVQSLRVFADPEFAGRVSIGDNVDDAYALASLVIGLTDWSGMTEAQFEEASAFLREVHKNVRLYWTDNTELSQAMAGGEVDIAWAWNETATTLAAEGQPVALKKDTDEGLATWVCGYVHLANGEAGEEKVYDYLNAILSPKVAETLVTDWGYGHSNGSAMAQMPQEVLWEKGYADVESFRDRTLFESPVPAELKLKMIAEFERIKAGY